MRVLERGPSLTEQAADDIRSRIVRGAFQLGEPLSEITLANDLGVSKTPVREALMQLKREGLVEVHPQRGTFVFSMTSEQVSKLSELRTILESAALQLTLERHPALLAERWAATVEKMERALARSDAERYRTLDGEFHRTLFELSENSYLLDAFTMIAFRVQALRNRLSLDPELNDTSFAEHVRLLELAREGRHADMAELLVRHVEWTRTHYLAELDRSQVPASGATRDRPRRRSRTG
jgi:DNA-binding GntR family transcriptional regulator